MSRDDLGARGFPVGPLGLEDEELNDVLGLWHVEADPPFTDKAPGNPDQVWWGEPGAGSTPFDFILKALLIENVEADYKPDLVDPTTGEKYTGGATFRAEGRFTAAGSRTTFEDENTRMVYKAKVYEDGGDVVRTLYGEAPVPGSEATPFTIDWDGKDDAGRPLSADIKYGVSITGMLDRGLVTDLTYVLGYIYNITPATGPPGVLPPPTGIDTIEVSPSDYEFYTEAEINSYAEDENGEPYWPDTDGDGEPNFPDHDEDGLEDFAAGDFPPPISISGAFDKTGYSTDWTLRAYDENDQEITGLHDDAYDGKLPATGNGYMSVEWLPPGELAGQPVTFKVTLNRCRNQPKMTVLGQSTGVVCYPKEVAQTVGGPPKLEVFPSSSNIISIADSTDKKTDPDVAAKERLGAVHTLENWQLSANLTGVPEGDRPKELSVQVESTISGVKPSLVKLTGGKDTGIYSGHLTTAQTEGLIKAERPASGGSDANLDAETTYSSGSTLEESQTKTFFSMLQNLTAESPKDAAAPDLVTFATPRQGLGRLTPLKDSMIEDDEALFNYDNLSKFGFEAVTFSLLKADNPTLNSDIVATLKVQNMPSVVDTVTYGGTNAILDLGLSSAQGNSQSGFFDPASVIRLDAVPKTWIIEGCNALDAYDYNNNRNSPNTPVSERSSPGADWRQVTQTKGNTVLLGYSHPVSTKIPDVIQEEFGRELDRLSGKVPPSLLQQYAWLSANVNVNNSNIGNVKIRGSLAACAWDNNYYYFIAYTPPYGQTRVERLADAVKESQGTLRRRFLGYYRVPIGELQAFPVVTSESNLPVENQVRIP